MCGSCQRLLTNFCTSRHAEVSYPRIQLYLALAFCQQRVTFCLPAGIELQALFLLALNILMLFRPLPPPSCWCIADLRWDTLCMAMNFLVPMSVFFSDHPISGYRMTETAKVLIAVTLCLLESLLLRILSWFNTQR